jgi:hypothetical protein
MYKVEKPAEGTSAELHPDVYDVSAIALASDLTEMKLWLRTRKVWKRFYLVEASS